MAAVSHWAVKHQVNREGLFHSLASHYKWESKQNWSCWIKQKEKKQEMRQWHWLLALFSIHPRYALPENVTGTVPFFGQTFLHPGQGRAPTGQLQQDPAGPQHSRVVLAGGGRAVPVPFPVPFPLPLAPWAGVLPVTAARAARAFVHRGHPGRVGRGDGWVADETRVCSKIAAILFVWSSISILPTHTSPQLYPVKQLDLKVMPRSWRQQRPSSPQCPHLPVHLYRFAKNTWTPLPWGRRNQDRIFTCVIAKPPLSFMPGLCSATALCCVLLCRRHYGVPSKKNSQTSWLRWQRGLQSWASSCSQVSQDQPAITRLHFWGLR